MLGEGFGASSGARLYGNEPYLPTGQVRVGNCCLFFGHKRKASATEMTVLDG